MTDTTTTKTRTITLTDLAPVQIREDQWPTIARAKGDSYGSGDYSRYQQARMQGELDEYTLVARQHADGRAIVYAVLSGASAWTGTEDRREGELLSAGADIAAALRRVGELCGLPGSVIREAIADLPAVEL
jgi:hypothetical protein